MTAARDSLRDIIPGDAGAAMLDAADDPAGVLLPYQSRINDRIKHPATSGVSDLPLLLVVEKSRRIGATWGVAMVCALTIMAKARDGGQNVYYMGYNLEMAREFVEVCAHWLKAFNVLAVSIDETIFSGDDENKDVKAFRIKLPSGHSIVALPSAPRVLRGKQGLVIVDEAAFHDALDELLKAAIALTFWGKGQVVLLSTHNGEENPFNTLIEAIRAGKRKGEVMRITLADALTDGLYKRICEVKGSRWSQAAQDVWEAELRDTYGDDAGEELDVIPAQGGGAVLPRALIKARMTDDFAVVRIDLPGDFVHLPEAQARATLRAILKEKIDPHLAALDPERKHFFGMDFARSVDLSVLPIGVETKNLHLHVPFVIELRNVPFREQEIILEYVASRLPRFMAGKLDARGNGQALAEYAQRRFGFTRIEAVMTSDAWYLAHMPGLVARFTDGDILIPADDLHVDDLAALKRIRGVIKLDAVRQGAAGVKRHGDYAMGLALLNAAAGADVAPVEGHGVGAPRQADGAFAEQGDDPRGTRQTALGWGSVGGGFTLRGF